MLIYSRRRRGRIAEADRYLRSVLSDALLIGWYDTRFPWTIDAAAVGSWGDARGASGYGPALVQATAADKPAYSASAQTITFDGVSEYLRATSATWNTITAAHAIVLVGTVPSTGATDAERMVETSTAAGASVLMIRREVSNGVMSFIAAGGSPSVGRAAPSGRSILHCHRTASSGGNVTVLGRVGSAASTTATAATTDATMNRLTLGASRFDVATLFADMALRAALVIKGDYTAAQQVAVNEWAKAVHGASV